NPPSPFLIDQKAFPPLGILHLAAAAREAGLDVLVRDLAGRESDMAGALNDLHGDLFGITATTPQYPWAKEVLRHVRRHNPGAIFVVGGAHPSSVPQVCLRDGFDAAVKGEGERAIMKVAREGARGVIEMPYVKDIDGLPLPARDLIDLREYAYAVDGRKATTIITSRGCPFRCSFCSKDVWKHRVRYHSVSRVVREIRECIERYGFGHFLFLDDTITLNRRRLLEMCRAIEPLGVGWRAYARTDTTTRDMLVAMKRAGCVEIGIGVESGSQVILDAACKGTTVAQSTRLVQDAKELGIATNAFIMIGLPGESLETVAATRRWMEENRPDKFGYNIFAPYMGTPVHEHPENYDITLYPMPDERSWVKGREDEYEAFVATSHLSREDILRLFKENFVYFQNLLNWRPGIGRVEGRKG
ncbi:MAG: B12-binding domain-containing radical SAM protein, partial [Planctomycetes bacterium]|nr:B12-binding domain-containing radical SAM protein [Planctomycetota bacterium]